MKWERDKTLYVNYLINAALYYPERFKNLLDSSVDQQEAKQEMLGLVSFFEDRRDEIRSFDEQKILNFIEEKLSTKGFDRMNKAVHQKIYRESKKNRYPHRISIDEETYKQIRSNAKENNQSIAEYLKYISFSEN